MRGLKFDVDDMNVKMANQDQTKILYIKQQLATIDHTPHHPVYPFMIQEAIMDLNEEGGSTKNSISQFITRKYDVSQVVHAAKLIEQLEKLVKKEEIVFTPENRFMLPAVDSYPPELNQGKRQLAHCKQDRRNNKMQKVYERIDVQGDRNAIMEVEDQPESNKKNEPRALQSEGIENQDHLQEDRVMSSEEERLEMTAEKISQVIQGQSRLIEEEKYRQLAEGVDEGRHGKEQIQVSGNKAAGERSQLQLEEVQVTEVQVGAERQSKVTEDLNNVEHLENEGINSEAGPQSSQDLYAEEHPHLEQTHIRTIDMKIETRGKEIEVIGERKTLQEKDNEVGNNATEISHTPESYVEKPEDEATITMPSSSQTSQQLDHPGSSLLLHTMKVNDENWT
ncbi:unnamed protein product [Dovyalis caffra]|uniref:H15 domain-containing protein n=1 Tax=Dovyalis caffra TaxID=77055 RepID=A0AAV1RAX0_9ROSI|nr:unnamed protein product [Dovyalis caffra]